MRITDIRETAVALKSKTALRRLDFRATDVSLMSVIRIKMADRAQL